MALHAAEEESIEAIKNWWDENGTFLTAVVAVAVIGWGGWTFWQNSRTTTIYAASDLYEEIISAVVAEGDDAEQRTLVFNAADQLKADHADTVYALYGALFAAQQAVETNDLDRAEEELQWLLANTQDGFFYETEEALILTANLRLGRIILAKGDAQRALDLIDSVDPQAFEAEFAELRGDIYVALGRNIDARDAYTAAQQAGSISSFLQMKLDELAQDS